MSLLPIGTATHAFPAFKGTSDLGAAPASMAMHVVIGLAPRNANLFAQIIKRQVTAGDPMFERYLTPAQVAMAFAPTGTSVQAVATYLVQNGLKT